MVTKINNYCFPILTFDPLNTPLINKTLIFVGSGVSPIQVDHFGFGFISMN
jgi:hypothetical protein